MSMLWILINVSVYLVKGNPCLNANGQEINICEKESRVEDQNSHNVIIRSDLTRNCSCELSINGQKSTQDIIFDKLGGYDSAQPKPNPVCGLIIHFFANTDYFYEAACSMKRITHDLNVNQKIYIKSITAAGTWQEGSGYCVEIKNERLVENNGALHLECGLQNEMSTTPSLPTTTLSRTNSVMTSTLHESLRDSTENGYSNTEWTFDNSESTSRPSLTSDKVESNSSVTIVVGAFVGCVVLILLIVITIFAVRKSRRGRSTSKRTTSEEQRVDDMNESENNSEYGLQYNSLYNMAFQPKPNNRTTAEYKDEPYNETKMTKKNISSEINEKDSSKAIVLAEEHDGYHTIDSAMEIRTRTSKTTNDKDGTYSTIDEYANHDESQLDDSDMVGRSRFPKNGTDGQDQIKSHHKNKTDNTEDNNNKDVYAVSNKRKIKHVITTSGCEYAMVNK